jgi:hypothetical protein
MNAPKGIPEMCSGPSDVVAELRALRTEMQAALSTMRTFAADLLLAQRISDRRHIVKATTQIYSQNYEDAIIAEIYSRIGERSRVFVEIGVQTGVECNTRALLERGWTGVWIDGNAQSLEIARANMAPYVQSGTLKIVPHLVTRENIQSIICDHIGSSTIDLLSVDVDYNTSHIWRAIESPHRVACIEYNAAHPPSVEWEVAYDPTAAWDRTNYFGASLKTLETIGNAKGLALVGCDFHGVNAFFVSRKLVRDQFLKPFTAERHFEPPRYALVGRRGHPPRARAVKT